MSVSRCVLFAPHMWRSEDILQELVLSYYVGPSDQTQVDSLGGKHLSLPADMFQRVHVLKDHNVTEYTRESASSTMLDFRDLKM